MKIDRTGPVRPTSPAKRGEKAGKAQGSSFSQHLKPGPEAVAGAVAPSPVSTVDALLSIQEVADSTTGQSKSRARKWGNDVLDQLEQIRIGLIGGVIPRHELERIAAMVDGKRERTDDPALEMILDEIELRAKVELAKLDRTP
jgi:Class II flagellar assembly regulator